MATDTHWIETLDPEWQRAISFIFGVLATVILFLAARLLAEIERKAE